MSTRVIGIKRSLFYYVKVYGFTKKINYWYRKQAKGLGFINQAQKDSNVEND